MARGSRRATLVVLILATVLGVWFGVKAPAVSPVAPPAPVASTAGP